MTNEVQASMLRQRKSMRVTTNEMVSRVSVRKSSLYFFFFRLSTDKLLHQSASMRAASSLPIYAMSSPARGRGLWTGRDASRIPPSRSPAPPLGNVIVTIHYDEIESQEPDQDDTVSRIRNSQYLTSYNWLGGEKSRIIVPGNVS
jgi:hypothetical protein